jgi:hypothetical protein
MYTAPANMAHLLATFACLDVVRSQYHLAELLANPTDLINLIIKLPTAGLERP